MSTNARIPDNPTITDDPCVAKSRPRLRRYVKYCGSLAFLLALVSLVITLLILCYKLRYPRITNESVAVTPISLDPVSLANKLTVVTHFAIKNRDYREPFKFDTIETSLSYRGRDIGSARLLAGEVNARRTFRGNVTVDATADRILNDPNWARDLRVGSIELDVVTRSVGGRIRTWYKRKGTWLIRNRRIDVSVKCNVSVSVPNLAVLSRVC